jgi:hypothetical protein
MKFIDNATDIKPKQNSEILYNVEGLKTSFDDKIFARALFIDVGNKTQQKFFIRTFNNVPFDPQGIDARREIWNRTELKSVSKKTFEYYIQYLTSKNSIYMTRTQRSYIDAP